VLILARTDGGGGVVRPNFVPLTALFGLPRLSDSEGWIADFGECVKDSGS
jgi:hypothetical protein